MIPGAIDGTVDILRELKRAGVPLYAAHQLVGRDVSVGAAPLRVPVVVRRHRRLGRGRRDQARSAHLPHPARALPHRAGRGGVHRRQSRPMPRPRQALGIHGIHFRSPELLRRELEALGLLLETRMSVSLGINPITWTNDDMPELGGDIPLDVCLPKPRMAGFAGIELGGKFPRDRARVAADPRAPRPAPRLGLVQRAAVPSASPTRRSPLSPTISHLLAGDGLHGHGLRRRPRQHRRRSGRAAFARGRCSPTRSGRRSARSWTPSRRICATRRSPRVPPPHGHGRRRPRPRSIG